MKTLKTSISHTVVNDVMVSEIVSLIGCAGTYFVAQLTLVDGGYCGRELTTSEPTKSYDEALQDYYEMGGRKN